MKKTNADYQAAYRRRHLRTGGAARINAVVHHSTKKALERWADHHGMTLRSALQQIIREAQERLTADMSEEEYRRYLRPETVAAAVIEDGQKF